MNRTNKPDECFVRGMLAAYYLTGRIDHDSYTCECASTMRDAIIEQLRVADAGFGVWLAARIFAHYGPIAEWRIAQARRSMFHDWPPYQEFLRVKYKEERSHGK